jgi:hypothetical protein
MKFDIELIKMIDKENISKIFEEETMTWPKPLHLMYRLCKSLIEYSYFLYGITHPSSLSGNSSSQNNKRESRSVSVSGRGGS